MKQLTQYIKESLSNSPFLLNEDRDQTINSISKKLNRSLISEDRDQTINSISKKLNRSLISEDRDQTIRLNDFEVSWTVKDPENHSGTIVLELPDDYDDDDVSQYLADMLSESMPSDEDLAKEYFGTNADHIIDVRFEYEKKELAKEGLHCTFNFDKSLDDQYKGEEKLQKYALTNLRFIVDWDQFDVSNTSDDGLMYDLWNIFKRTKSSNIVKYMNDKIKLDLSEKDLKFDNGKSELIKEK